MNNRIDDQLRQPPPAPASRKRDKPKNEEGNVDKDKKDGADNARSRKDKSEATKDNEDSSEATQDSKDEDSKNSSKYVKDKKDAGDAVKDSVDNNSAPNGQPNMDTNPQAWNKSDANPKNRPSSPSNQTSSRSGSPAKAPNAKKDGELPSQDRSRGPPLPPPQAADEPADKLTKTPTRALKLNNVSNGSKAKPKNPGKDSLGWAVQRRVEGGG